MKGRRLGIVCAVLALASVLGIAVTAHAATGVLRVMISGALAAPSGTSGDGQVTLRLGAGLPVFLVSDGGAVIAGSIATATFAQWSDTVPTPGFGPAKTLMVFRLPGGVMVVAGAISTPGGPVTTFSATSPVETISGTWTMTSGMSPSDAVVTFSFDTNPSNTISGVVRFVADGYLPAVVHKTIPGMASVDVQRNIPVRGVADNTVGPPVGTLVSYSAYQVPGHPSEFVALTAVNLGGVYVVYACAFPQLPGGIACPIGGAGPAAHLSGNVSEVAGQFFTSPPNAIAGVDTNDLVITLVGSLP